MPIWICQDPSPHAVRSNDAALSACLSPTSRSWLLISLESPLNSYFSQRIDAINSKPYRSFGAISPSRIRAFSHWSACALYFLGGSGFGRGTHRSFLPATRWQISPPPNTHRVSQARPSLGKVTAAPDGALSPRHRTIATMHWPNRFPTLVSTVSPLVVGL